MNRERYARKSQLHILNISGEHFNLFGIPTASVVLNELQPKPLVDQTKQNYYIKCFRAKSLQLPQQFIKIKLYPSFEKQQNFVALYLLSQLSCFNFVDVLPSKMKMKLNSIDDDELEETLEATSSNTIMSFRRELAQL